MFEYKRCICWCWLVRQKFKLPSSTLWGRSRLTSTTGPSSRSSGDQSNWGLGPWMGLRSGKLRTRFKAKASQFVEKKSWIPQDVPSSSLHVAKSASSNLFLCHQLFLRACPKCDTFLDRKFIQISVWLLVKKPSATHSFCLHLLTVLLCTSTCVQIFFTCLCLHGDMFLVKHIFVCF